VAKVLYKAEHSTLSYVAATFAAGEMTIATSSVGTLTGQELDKETSFSSTPESVADLPLPMA
jgi:hypothetical protein